MRWVDGIMDPMNMSLSKFWETLEDRGAWQSVHGVARVGHDLATKREREVCHSFVPRSKCLLISWLQSPSAVSLEPRK